MPNHVENIISVSGSEQEIQRMLKRIKSDMFGVGTLDFEKIIPMPESLNIESGTRTDRGLRAYRERLTKPHGTTFGSMEPPLGMTDVLNIERTKWNAYGYDEGVDYSGSDRNQNLCGWQKGSHRQRHNYC